ncbi:hypothetical protein AB0G06_43700 [Nonomuraea dietziae]|uniref:hypothetical protein n=1 Tax=Nonomuraea dietziae TaxID=65515 RepID=UPI0033C78540
MPLMTVADIEVRTKQVYEGEDIDQVQALIDDVTGLIEDFLGLTYETVAPPRAVKALACMEVRRHLNTDPGIAAERVGDLNTNYAHGGAVVALSDDVEAKLRRYRRRRGIGSIRVISHLVPDPVVEDPGGTP